MLYVKWFVFFLMDLFMTYAINLPFAPIIVLFANQNGWLPKWLFWFQTPDNSLDGDYGWKTENRPYLNESNRYQRWINRFHWLWRNSVYGFSQSVLGVKYLSTDKFVIDGNPEVGNGPGGTSGLVRRYLYREGKKIAFQWYYVRQYARWPDKCIRINIGWKVWQFKDPSYPALHHVFSISPWMHFTK